jgi:Bromodomain
LECRFALFAEPVDQEDAPDYYDIIKNPMDMSTMYEKVNKYEYNCAADFLADINLICQNCLEYNPDRHLRSTACHFRDSVHAVIKAEMDTDFEDNCKKISESRKSRKFDSKPYLIDFIHVAPPVEQKDNNHETDADETADLVNGDADTSMGTFFSIYLNFSKKVIFFKAGAGANSSACSMTPESRQKKRKSRWSSGIISRPKKKKTLEKADEAGKTDSTMDQESAKSSPSKSPVPSASDVNLFLLV